MKLITVLLIATMMQVSAASFAQKLTLKKDNISLEQLFKEIRKQTGYAVIYTKTTIKDSKTINADFQNTPIEEVLTTSLKNQNLKFEIDTKNIIITKAPPTFLDRLANSWADRDIRGRIVDEKGSPLPNASIRVKGKEGVTNTNEKGEFLIKNVADDAVLVISYVGYKELEIAVKGAVMPLEIKLNQVTGELEEVNVSYSTGYQNIPKERATGSFVQINNELFNRKVGATVLDRILEVTSGLLASGGTQSSNGAGIQIRGNSTINSSKIPLIVVDNFIFEGDLDNLNPNDIENITVLKDAAAASIWGVRAGNGVIVITTKKGKYNQDNKISFNTNATIGAKPDLDYVKTISSRDWVEFEKKQFADSVYNTFDDDYPSFSSFPILSQGAEILLSARKKNKGVVGYNALNDPLVNQQLDELASYDVKDDVRKYLLQNSVGQQYALNASGGGNKYFYYTSVGFDKSRSISVRNENRRLNFNFNNTYQLFRNLELNSFISYTQLKTDNNGFQFTSFLPTGNTIAPYTRLADIQGNALAIPYGYRLAYVDTAAYPALLDWHYRPLDELKNNNIESKQYDTRIGAGIKYTIIPGLNTNVNYGYQRWLTNGQGYYNQETYMQRDRVNTFMALDPFNNMVSTPYPMGDYIEKLRIESINWNFRAGLDFNRTIGNHAISAIGGIEYRETKTSIEKGFIHGFDPNTSISVAINPSVLYPTRFGGLETTGIGPYMDGNINRFGSYFANVGYTCNRRYVFSASARVDQSNFFGLKANQRITPLWSAGLAWSVSNEDFYHLEFLPNLKLRTTYGYNGNTNGGSALATISYVNRNGVVGYSSQYAIITTPNNPQLRWEKVKQINYAIDFSTRNNRISGSIEYYTKRGKDLIGPILTDPTVGWSYFVGNRASIKGKGLDFNLNSINIKNGLNWQSAFLLSYNTDKVTSYDEKPTSTSSYLYNSVPIVGKSLNNMYSYRWAGLDPSNGTARLYLSDTISNNINVDKAHLSDLVYHGSGVPRVFGSLRNTFSYQQLSLSFNITYKMNYYFRRTSVSYGSIFNANYGWGGHSDYSLRWMNPGDELITDVPALPPSASFDQRDVVYRNSDILVEVGDHIRLQDIRMDYNLNRSKIKGLPFQNVRFYVYINNLGILWARNKQGIDPDHSSFTSLPVARTTSVGLNVTF